MHRKYFYGILGVTVFCLLLIAIFLIGNAQEQPVRQDVQVSPPPFSASLSAVGIVEPQSGNIHIGSPFSRVIKKINVSVNECVKQGSILFQLDHDDLEADLQIKKKEAEKARANLYKLQSLPQPEDLIIARQALTKACVALNGAKKAKNLPNFQVALAEYNVACAQFQKVKNGAWQPELNIAQFGVEQAQAAVKAIETQIEQTYVKSPIEGTVLQVKIHEGETLNLNEIAIVVGNIEELNLRVKMNQFNSTLFDPSAQAVAFRQGDLSCAFPLKFMYSEPVMLPKKYITSEAYETVDTQIFEILYRIEKKEGPLWIGQPMDVYIDIEK